MNGDTLHNLINMEQVVSGSHQMTIDADTQLNIRTPKVYVSNYSYGEGTGTVYETITSTPNSMYDNPPYYIVQNLGKIESYDSPTDDVQEGRVPIPDEEEDWWVYCTLPVYVTADYKPLKFIHGMLIGAGTTESVVI